MGYGTLEHAFWDDPDLQELGLEGLAVAAYVVTCRHSTSEGYYRLAIGYVCEDLRIDRQRALGYLRALDLKNFARYDETSQVVFIRNALRFRPPKGNPSITGALRRATEVPLNPFRGLFYDAACQWAPDFAEVLRDAGWTSEVIRAPQLFESCPPEPLPPPPPAALMPGPSLEPEPVVVEAIMRQAAELTVQQSIAKREPIRNPEAVAKVRLAKHAETWRPIVERWLSAFDAPPVDMARALADGGTAKPHWQRVVS